MQELCPTWAAPVVPSLTQEDTQATAKSDELKHPFINNNSSSSSSSSYVPDVFIWAQFDQVCISATTTKQQKLDFLTIYQFFCHLFKQFINVL